MSRVGPGHHNVLLAYKPKRSTFFSFFKKGNF